MGLKSIDLFCDSFKSVPARIVLDIDDTPDTVHGGQQLAFFNAHYDEYIFQPIHIFEAATGKPVLSLLRPASGLPGKRRLVSSSTSFAASVAIGPGWTSWSVAMATTGLRRS